MNAGAYTSQLVKQFAAEADDDAWDALGNAISHRDMPVLEGLRYILEAMIDGESGHRADTEKGLPRIQTRRLARKARPVEIGEFFA